MKILGIGIDIVKKERIRNIFNKYKDKFIKRILNSKEINLLEIKKDKIEFISKCFALKEATAKAIGTGFRKKIIPKNIIVKNNKLGKPIIKIENFKLKNKKIYATISHEKDNTIALVIITKKLIAK